MGGGMCRTAGVLPARQQHFPHVRTGESHITSNSLNMALSSSKAFPLSPVFHCLLNLKRLPGGGFKKR